MISHDSVCHISGFDNKRWNSQDECDQRGPSVLIVVRGALSLSGGIQEKVCLFSTKCSEVFDSTGVQHIYSQLCHQNYSRWGSFISTCMFHKAWMKSLWKKYKSHQIINFYKVMLIIHKGRKGMCYHIIFSLGFFSESRKNFPRHP